MANKEIRELEIQVSTKGTEKAIAHLDKLQKMQKDIAQGFSGKGSTGISGSINSRFTNLETKIDNGFNRIMGMLNRGGGSSSRNTSSSLNTWANIRQTSTIGRIGSSNLSSEAMEEINRQKIVLINKEIKQKEEEIKLNRAVYQARREELTSINARMKELKAEFSTTGTSSSEIDYWGAINDRNFVSEENNQFNLLKDKAEGLENEINSLGKAMDSAKHKSLKLKEEVIKRSNTDATKKQNKALNEWTKKMEKSNMSMGRMTGNLMLYMGAITMVSFAAQSAFQKLLAIGDSFATAETNRNAYLATTHSMYNDGGSKYAQGFLRANEANQRATGLDKYSSGIQVARAVSMIKENQGRASESALIGLLSSAQGAATLTGGKYDTMIPKILEVAKAGKGTDKLGLKELKLTKDINQNITLIYKEMQKNSLASSAMKGNTLSASMQRIRSTPATLGGNLMDKYEQQIKFIFRNIGNVLLDTVNDTDVIKAWGSTISNLEDSMSRVFNKKNMKESAIGLAKWTAELIRFGEIAMRGTQWFLKNKDFVSEIAKMAIAFKAMGTIGSLMYKGFKAYEWLSTADFAPMFKLHAMAGIVYGGYKAFVDGANGFNETDGSLVDKSIGAIVHAMFGSKSGFSGAWDNALKMAGFGLSGGALVGGPVGAAAGALIGGIVGAFSGFFESDAITKWVIELKNSVWTSIKNAWESTKSHLKDVSDRQVQAIMDRGMGQPKPVAQPKPVDLIEKQTQKAKDRDDKQAKLVKSPFEGMRAILIPEGNLTLAADTVTQDYLIGGAGVL
ncbi:MAG: hypothetical protein ACRDDH_14505 [Cetobacterium sp.]|uniref:hypothetical protein n=1 Tax=Cetobacterium sp. TaxID=2071632 RepID=UPI003EE628F1